MGGLRQYALAATRPLHSRFRMEKVKLFFELTDGAPRGTLLDVGGGAGIAGEFESMYEAFRPVVVVNLNPPKQGANRRMKHEVRFVLGDGCRLPFASGSFDWVFSNAVIEHVGNWERQRAFANEVRRVAARGYFVTTPNKYFPIEPHTLCPFYQFLPVAVQKRIVRWTPGYLTEYAEINLLTKAALHTLFPEAEVRAVGFPVWENSLVAFHRVSVKNPLR